MTRRTATLLFTDLVDSTALASTLGPTVAQEVRRSHFDVLRAAMEPYHGTEVKNLGDGLMIVFEAAADGLAAAAAMQQAVDVRNREVGEDLAIRIGIAAGDVHVEEGDFFGQPVVEAARLCGEAVGGQILATEAVRVLAGSHAADFGARTELVLKGLEEPTGVVEVAWEPVRAEALVRDMPNALAATGPMYGRVEEAEKFDDAWKAAQAGEHRVLLVNGEAGAGKTCFAAYAARTALDAGGAVFYGRSDADLALPYQPWVQVLTQIMADPGARRLEATLAENGAVLAKLLPARFGEASGRNRAASVEPDMERYLLLAAVTNVLERLAGEVPVLVVLDDLQWADASTLHLLRHIAAAPPFGLVILGTFRHSDIAALTPLAETLALLHAEPRVERLPLRGLGDEETLALVTSLAGHELDQEATELAHILRVQTEGNPFFIIEMLRHLADVGAIGRDEGGHWAARAELGEHGLPVSVREVIGRRIAALSSGTQRVLGLASVIGREFDLRLLAPTADLDEDAVIDLVEPAISEGLIAEVPSSVGRFMFVHALIGQALYEGLTAIRRQRAHRRVAEELESLLGDHPGDRVGELASHWSKAVTTEDVERALTYTQRTAELSLRAAAPEDARRHFEDAIALWERSASRDVARQAALLVGLGTAQRQLADTAHRETLLRAARLASLTGERETLIQAALAMNRGMTSTTGTVDPERIATIEEALAAVEPQSAAHARLLAILAMELLYEQDDDRRFALADESVTLARALADPATLLETLNATYMVVWSPDNFEHRGARTRDAVEIARALGDPIGEFWARSHAANLAKEAGDLATQTEHTAVSVAIANELRQPTLLWLASWEQFERAMFAGSLEEAELRLDDVIQLGASTEQPDLVAISGFFLFWLRRDQGRLGELVPLILELEEQVSGIPAIRAGLAAAQLQAGNADAASALLEDAMAQGLASIQRNLSWLTAMGLWADVSIRLGSDAVDGLLYDELLPFEHMVDWNSAFCSGSVSDVLARLATSSGRIEDARRHLEIARATHARMESPYFIAQTCLTTAQWALRAGEGSAEEAQRCIELARRHGFAALERDALALEAV